tara:strand:+ start:286 stop:462 length:177 start_codon:yes stop_codon:yes gene_type:complete
VIKRTVIKEKFSIVVDDSTPKWFVKKRTGSGVYITIAEGETRKEIIDQLKADSETYKK